jgi:glycosyltransferase involved in cell wall biosynthesis
MSVAPNFVPISAVIPAHNAEPYLRQAIESVLAQSCRVREIIVVADDCTDNTVEIAESLGATVHEIRARNISAARNAGVRGAKQKWIAFLDADDYWHPNKIERQWKAVLNHPDVAVVSCDYYLVRDSGTSAILNRKLRQGRDTISCPSIKSGTDVYFPTVEGCILRWFDIGPQAALVQRELFQTGIWFDEKLFYLQDLEFFARALKNRSLVMIEEPLVYRRLRADSHSANTEGKWEAYFSIVDRMLQHSELYVPHAGEQYREHLKLAFASNERELAAKRRRTVAVSTQQTKPTISSQDLAAEK